MHFRFAPAMSVVAVFFWPFGCSARSPSDADRFKAEFQRLVQPILKPGVDAGVNPTVSGRYRRWKYSWNKSSAKYLMLATTGPGWHQVHACVQVPVVFSASDSVASRQLARTAPLVVKRKMVLLIDGIRYRNSTSTRAQWVVYPGSYVTPEYALGDEARFGLRKDPVRWPRPTHPNS